MKTSQITAVLGPTNTGKTHLAVERMMGHSDGIIGLPLRLLAREVYDRIVRKKGAASVALVTGEEKIIPPHAAYFVCTVEAMPLDRGFQFVAVDEIQLAADPERGHVFTDRLLYARGRQETMFLGAETIRPWIQRLIPDAVHVTRDRLSRLSYRGPKKISRLPSRSAIVTFSANDVYAIAELIRRQRGGAAVVMGNLSPRTRNAQVEMYQSGEVDFLVATDAIGMGLNMDIDHVAFASTYKFDGVMSRSLTPAEFSQIAGRAGRHMNDGTFGTTAHVQPFDEDLIEQIEDHRFEKVKHIRWRNRDLAFNTARDLLRTLEQPSKHKGMISPREPDDYLALKTLSADPEIQHYSRNTAKVRQLWQVCQIPDFRKTMHDAHIRLLKRVYLGLQQPGGKLPTDWIADQINKLKKTDGDIDTLATRIAHIRTWTYISHVSEWVDDYKHWQNVARGIEDNLSDALHEQLTQRFVDRRTAMLVRKLKDSSQLEAVINEAGDVHVEGHFIGTLTGLRFAADMTVNSAEARTLRNVGNKTVAKEITSRAQAIAASEDETLSLTEQGEIVWQDVTVGRLSKGDSVLRPKVNLLASEQLNGPALEAATKRLQDWVNGQIATRLTPLVKLADLPLTGAARGIAFQVSENLGALPRFRLNEQIRMLDKKDFGRLKFGGLRVGYEHVFMPLLLKPDPTALRCLLWAIHEERKEIPAPPPAGRVSFEVTDRMPRAFYLTAGYALFDNLAVRLDMLDRLAGLLRRASRGLLETEDKKPATETAATETAASETGAAADAPAPEAQAKQPSEAAPQDAAPEAQPSDAEATQATEAPEAAEDTPAAETSPAEPEAEAATEEASPAGKPAAKEADTGKAKNKKDLPRNLPFKPTHEMLSLVGTTREQFTLILEHLGYKASGEGEELIYQKAPFKKRKKQAQPAGKEKGPRGKGAGAPRKAAGPGRAKPTKTREIDPDSPFAVLKNLGTK
ncbi:helicase-related protein [Sneathiella chinensis]|uniref:Helicase n=1 Tax=Sneathiella chinensis TaxID=349750 RepID=A0ABQ5U0E5_9PROT|nr:helicase-related protein [Sneathiella chinensis]GLQ05610.1 helicase [Sneathiella chinensis]